MNLTKGKKMAGQSRKTHRSQLSQRYQQSQQLSTEKYSTLNSRTININNNNNNTNNNNTNNKTLLNQQDTFDNQDQLQQIIDTLTIYIKSANQLKNYLSIPNEQTPYRQQNSLNKLSAMLSSSRGKYSTDKQSQTLMLVITKINMFITTTQSQLNKLHQSIESSSLSQLKTLPFNYNQILTYTQQKYSQLLKQTYRTLNIETLLNHEHLSQRDMKIVKENKMRKLKQMKDIERELEDVWTRSTTHKNKTNPNSNNMLNQNNNYSSSSSKPQQLMVNFTTAQSQNPRNLEILQLSNNTNVNLRQLAKQQLQKQFLAIRIQAYNMYEKYINHSHKQYEERLKFVKQEQDIIETQLNQEIQLAQTIHQEYQRVKRQLAEVKTINQLIKKRYILRESIIMDSRNSLYHT